MLLVLGVALVEVLGRSLAAADTHIPVLAADDQFEVAMTLDDDLSHTTKSDDLASTAPSTTPTDPVIDKLNMVCAALEKFSKNRGRETRKDRPTGSNKSSRSSSRERPDSKFKGCWHCCKKDGHQRKDGRAFIALKKRNDGKPHPKYEGAYEKAKRLHREALRAPSNRSQEYTICCRRC